MLAFSAGVVDRMSVGGDMDAREAAWWRDWRGRDFSWDGLAAMPAGDGATFQDYWRGEDYRLISEPGTTRRWTRFHCPFVFENGSPSPKASWTADDWRDLEHSLRTRLMLSSDERPCRLDGIVLRGLDEGGDDAGEAYLWLSARWAYFRTAVDLRNTSLGLSDFQGAWFGGHADFSGARQLQPNFSGVAHASPEPAAARTATPLPRPAPQPAQAAVIPVAVQPETVIAPPPAKPEWGWRVVAGLAASAAIAAVVAVLLRK